jgi:uncharacterized protein YcbX
MYKLSGIYIYPIKSLGGISITSSLVEKEGLEYDRRWMLVDEQHRFITQRELPELCLFELSDLEYAFSVLHQPTGDKITIDKKYEPINHIEVSVWNDKVYGGLMPDELNYWFSKKTGIDCKLVKLMHSTNRLVTPPNTIESYTTSFADAYPVLMIGEASLTNLQTKTEEKILMNRFRPNIVFNGGHPHDEDMWVELKIGDAIFKNSKPCARCIITTIQQENAIKTPEPLRTLNTYRKANNSVYFGQNAVVIKPGVISIGNELIIYTNNNSERNSIF